MKTKQLIGKKKIVISIGGVILLVVAYFLFDNRAKEPVEYPFTACQGEYCIKLKKISTIRPCESCEVCITDEEYKMICGDYVLTIDPKVPVKVQ